MMLDKHVIAQHLPNHDHPHLLSQKCKSYLLSIPSIWIMPYRKENKERHEKMVLFSNTKGLAQLVRALVFVVVHEV
jgi:hypothetical protein